MLDDNELYYHYEQSILALGTEVSEHLNPIVGDRITNIATNLAKHRLQRQSELVFKKLTGEGPVATLKYKLGITRGYGMNLLQRVPEAERATRDSILALIQEFLVPEQTGLVEGGDITLPMANLKELPADMANLQTGLYRYQEQQRILFVIQVIGVNYGFLIISLPQIGGLPIILRVVSYVEGEKEWVDHDHLEFCSLKSIRAGLLVEFKKLGHTPPLVVAQKQLLALLNTLEPQSNKRFRNLVISLQNYRVKASYHETLGYAITVYHTTQLNYSLTPEESELPWNSLSATKQSQLYALFLQRVNELKAV